jgi:hypothetical protein
MSCRIGPNTELEQGAAEGQPSPSFEETNPFPEQCKHRMHNPSIGSLYNIYFMVEDGTRIRWAQLDSLIVNAKGGH